VFEDNGVKVLVDPKAWPIDGTQLDFARGLNRIGSSNPNDVTAVVAGGFRV
jgi:Fe-S cluster assembly iron-binding protein IscA